MPTEIGSFCLFQLIRDRMSLNFYLVSELLSPDLSYLAPSRVLSKLPRVLYCSNPPNIILAMEQLETETKYNKTLLKTGGNSRYPFRNRYAVYTVLQSYLTPLGWGQGRSHPGRYGRLCASFLFEPLPQFPTFITFQTYSRISSWLVFMVHRNCRAELQKINRYNGNL